MTFPNPHPVPNLALMLMLTSNEILNLKIPSRSIGTWKMFRQTYSVPVTIACFKICPHRYSFSRLTHTHIHLCAVHLPQQGFSSLPAPAPSCRCSTVLYWVRRRSLQGIALLLGTSSCSFLWYHTPTITSPICEAAHSLTLSPALLVFLFLLLRRRRPPPLPSRQQTWPQASLA